MRVRLDETTLVAWHAAGSKVVRHGEAESLFRPLVQVDKLARTGRLLMTRYLTPEAALGLTSEHEVWAFFRTPLVLERFVTLVMVMQERASDRPQREPPLLTAAPKRAHPKPHPASSLPWCTGMANRPLLDQDYRHRLPEMEMGWLDRFTDHYVHNRFRKDGHDLVPLRSPGARALHRLYNVRNARRSPLLPFVASQEGGASDNPEDALLEWIESRWEKRT